MNKENIWQNITRSIAGEGRRGDNEVVDKWLSSDQINEKVYGQLQEIWSHKSAQNIHSPRIYNRFLQRKENYYRTSRFANVVKISVRIAAVLFFFVSSTFLVQQITGDSNPEIVMQEITVPKGCRSSVILPDSSRVWISNNTTLKYPSQFVGKFREVTLSGEGYFEVEHNTKRPFIVSVGEHRIKVLGTKFSVTAYPDDEFLKTDLISGSVQLDIRRGNKGYQSFIINPSHSLVYNKISGKLISRPIPDGFYQYWHEGIYEFKNETLESLAVKINRIYNTEIIFEHELIKHKRFSGSLTVNDNVFTFMEAIKRTSVESIEYTHVENKLYISLKN